MKKISSILCFIFIAGIAMAQVQTIHDPGATPTVKNEDIVAWGQSNSQNGSRALITLNFEGAGDDDALLNFYNGGLSQQGFSGTNYGISFTANSLSIIDSDAGGSGNFANEPSANTILFFLDGTADTMNVPAGFVGNLSFWYTANVGGPIVTIFDGIDGAGAVLATVNLSQNYQDGDCSGDPTGAFCNWDLINMPFAGTANSVTFSGVANQCAFDDISLNLQQTEAPISNWALILGTVLIAAFIGIRILFPRSI